jgi:hypothetical protein
MLGNELDILGSPVTFRNTDYIPDCEILCPSLPRPADRTDYAAGFSSMRSSIPSS